MSVFTGKVTESVVKGVRRFTKFIGMGKFDTKEHRVISSWGEESVPIKDSVAIWAHSSVSGESVVIGYINKNAVSSMSAGEKRIFSTNSSGEEQIQIYLRDDAKIELGGNSDNLVSFTDLKTAFDQLKSEVNAMVTTFNTHTHATPSGPSLVPVPLQSAATADMSNAKIDELLCS